VIASSTSPSSALSTDLEVRNTTTGAGNPATVVLRQTLSNTTNSTVLTNLDFGDEYQTTGQARIQTIRGAAGGANDNPTDMLFYTTPDGSATLAERMRISNSGNVGIGANPVEALEIYRNGSNPVQLFHSAGVASYKLGNDGNVFKIAAMDNGYGGHTGNFATNDVQVLSMTTTGNVGIGNVAPNVKLNVGEAIPAGHQLVYVRGYGDEPGWKGGAAFGYTSASVIMGQLYNVATIGGHAGDLNAWADLAINVDGGNVGVGLSAPLQKFHVVGTGRFSTLASGFNRFVYANATGDLMTSTSDINPNSLVDGAGTLDYIPKWTPDGNTLGNSQMFDNGTSVGIGLTNPGARLTIRNNATDPGVHDDGKTLFVSGTFGSGQVQDGGVEFRHDNLSQGIGFGYNTIYQTGTNPNEILNIIARGTGAITLNAYGGATGNVGIGTTTPLGKLDVRVPGSGTWERFVVKTSSLWGDGLAAPSETAGTQYVTIGAGGAAGIMINNPHVVWNGGNSAAAIRYGRAGGVTAGEWWEAGVNSGSGFHIRKNATVSTGIGILSDGNVGIGTETAASKLHVMGKLNIHQSGAGGGQNRFEGIEAPTSANGRGQLVISSAYSDLIVASSNANENHGSTITLASYDPGSAASYRKWVINQGNWGARSQFLDFGYAVNNPNPHTAISSANTTLTLDGTNRRVGINVISPSSKLEILHNTTLANGMYDQSNIEVVTDNASNPSIGFHRSGHSATALYHAGYGNNSLRIRNADGLDAALLHEGNMGTYGIQNQFAGAQSANFWISGASNVEGNYQLDGVEVIGNTGSDVYGNIRVLRSLSTIGDGMYLGYQGSGGPMRFFSNSGTTEWMSLTTTGNLGIGTTAPVGKLHVGGNHANGVMADGNDRPSIAATGVYPQMVMMSGNSANPNHGATLMIGGYDSGASGAHKHWSIGTSGQNSTFLDFGYHAGTDLNPHAGIRNYNGSTFMTILNSGLVGIGNMSPSYRLDVAGDVRSNIASGGYFWGRLHIDDTRAVNSPPTTFDNELRVEFKERAVVGAPGSAGFGGLMTIAPWGDNSGGNHHQLFFSNDGMFNRQGAPDAAGWDAWSQLVTSAAGNNGYIQNQNAAAQTANFWISGEARARVFNFGHDNYSGTSPAFVDGQFYRRDGQAELAIDDLFRIRDNSGTVRHEFNSDAGEILLGPNPGWGRFLRIGGNGNQTGEANIATTDGNLHLDSRSGHAIYLQSYSGNNTFINPGGGSVGIGTTAPVDKLDVRSAMSVNEIKFRNLDGGDDSDPYRLRKQQFSGNNNELQLHLNDDANERFAIYGNSCSGYGCGEYSGNLYHWFRADGYAHHAGHLGVGTNIPNGYRVEIPNIGNASGRFLGQDYYIYSSERWKTNIHRIDRALDVVKRLRGVEYDYSPENGGSHQSGFIVEEVAEVLPHAVDLGKDGNTPTAMSISAITPYLLEAIKEQQTMIEALKQQVEELQKRLDGK